jgi:hypothetical protein
MAAIRLISQLPHRRVSYIDQSKSEYNITCRVVLRRGISLTDSYATRSNKLSAKSVRVSAPA